MAKSTKEKNMAPRPRFRQNTCYRQHKDYKAKIRERDNHTCQECGGKLGEHGIRQLGVAHIVPWIVSRDSSPDNLRTLCHSCNKREQAPQCNARLPIAQWSAKLERELQEL